MRQDSGTFQYFKICRKVKSLTIRLSDWMNFSLYIYIIMLTQEFPSPKHNSIHHWHHNRHRVSVLTRIIFTEAAPAAPESRVTVYYTLLDEYFYNLQLPIPIRTEMLWNVLEITVVYKGYRYRSSSSSSAVVVRSFTCNLSKEFTCDLERS